MKTDNFSADGKTRKTVLASPEESNACLERLLGSIGLFLDCLHFPIAIINVEGRYVYYNSESAQLDGCSREFALGNHLLNVYPQMEPEESTQLQSLYEGKCFSSHEANYFNARGKLLHYMHTTTPLYGDNGQTIGAIEIGWDISQVAKLQNQILSLTKQLTSKRKGGKSAEADEPTIITRSPVMREAIEKARRFAKTNLPVVILGESGTGKELIAELIQRTSMRADKPFVTLNCGALTETLIDSSLFGTVKGAYTGADDSPGYLEFADGGTLFLDEFNSIPMSMQVKLLRFFQNKTFNRVGSPKTMKSDVRIIVAMNESPNRLITEGRLRSDLYWRLCVAEIELPPLRHRREDIPLLVEHFIEKHSSDIAHRITGITPSALAELMRLKWPGNIRMLENVVLRSMVMQESDGPIDRIAGGFFAPGPIVEASGKKGEGDRFRLRAVSPEEDAPDQAVLKPGGPSLTDRMKAFEENLIAQAIEQTKGNVSAASELLQINRTTLNYKLKKLGFTRASFNPDA